MEGSVLGSSVFINESGEIMIYNGKIHCMIVFCSQQGISNNKPILKLKKLKACIYMLSLELYKHIEAVSVKI